MAGAKLFGYSGLSLILPQALAGVLSVAVLYRLVSHTFGVGAGQNAQSRPFAALQQRSGRPGKQPARLALLGLLVAAWRRLPRFPLDWWEQLLVLWEMWLLTMDVFFRIAGFVHAYYVVMFGPACGLWPRLIRAQEAG